MPTIPRRSMLTGALAGLLSPLLLRGDHADARPHRRRPRRPPTIRLVVRVRQKPIRFDIDPTIPLAELPAHQPRQRSSSLGARLSSP